MTCRQKEYLYPLNIILKDLINYRGGIINLEIKPVIIKIKGKEVMINFDILLLGNNKAVLGMPWLQEYNLKINWIIGDVKIQDTLL